MSRYLLRGLLLSLLAAPFAGVRAQVPAADSLALVSLWNAAGGPGWAMNSSPTRIGWTSTTPEGEPTWVGQWFGVSVRDNRVLRINLLRENLVGQLSPELAGLTNPRDIGIWFNSGETGNLHGPIPESFGTMKSLEQLVLTGNMLTGGIPDTLASLPNLQSLSLAGNPLGGGIPPALGRLSKLEDLNLGDAELVGEIPPELGNLGSLTGLRLDNNSLSGSIPSTLGELSGLTVLWLQSNELTGILPASIGNLTNLSALRADGNMLEGPIPASWGGLASLRQLWVGGNHLSGTLPEELENLSSLEALTLAFNEFSGPVPESFTQLTALRNLNIHENDFESMPDLSALPNLEQLRVFGNRLTFEHLEPMAGLLGNPRITTFFYAPQDSVDLDVRLEEGQIILSMPAGGKETEYRWYRDDVEVTGVTGSDYPMSAEDRGVIRAEATNPLLPDLTLHSRPIGMVIVVNSTGDAHNRPGAAPGFCDTGVEIRVDEPECTLRAAIEAINAITPSKTANENPVAVVMHNIFFNGDLPTIEVAEELPQIENQTVIDGSSQLGGKVSLRGDDRSGFRLDTKGSSIVGYEVDGFPESAFEINAENVTIDRCAALNSGVGVMVKADGANVVSSTISGNSRAGIYLSNASKSHILLNKIGIADDGETPMPNGIGIEIAGGGGGTFRNNVVSGNLVFNIRVDVGESPKLGGNFFKSNQIGTNERGTHAVRAESDLMKAAVLDLGFESIFEDNTISGNPGNGLELRGSRPRVLNNKIGTTGDGSGRLGNEGFGVALYVGNGAILRGNTISDNGRAGVLAESTDGQVEIERNRIGTDATGTVDLGNHGHGIEARHVETIGLHFNTISGNDLDGLNLTCRTVVIISRNKIGTDEAGSAPIPNGGAGVSIGDCLTVNLGANTISGNRADGVRITDGVVNMKENRIGTDESRLEPIGNEGHGIRIARAAVVDARTNVISANGRSGIHLDGHAPGGMVELHDNIIGTNRNGDAPDADMSNLEHGVHVAEGKNVWINEGNTISNNGAAGVFLERSESVVVRGSQLYENDVGIRVVEIGNNTIYGNRIEFNRRNIDAVDATRQLIIVGNDVSSGTGDGTGIHLTNSKAVITGNHFFGDAGDAVTLERGSTAEISRNNFLENAGFGVNNLDPSTDVVAVGNWWGDASGPSGAGPGTGDAVSDNVDFSGWMSEPVGVVVTALEMQPLLVGEPDTTSIFVNNWTNRDDVVDLHINEQRGWLIEGPVHTVALADSLVGLAPIATMVPAGTPDGTQNAVEVIATSRGNPALADTLVFTLVAQAAVLTRLAVSPDSIGVLPGDTVRFEAFGMDQFGRDLPVSPEWRSSGGSIDDNGLFVAPPEAGDYAVIATDPASRLEAIGVASVVSGVGTEQNGVSHHFELGPNYPNPFNPSTSIAFSLAATVHAHIAVYDVLGRRVGVLVDEPRAAGQHEVRFDASHLPSGLYFCVMNAGEFRAIRKMMFVK